MMSNFIGLFFRELWVGKLLINKRVILTEVRLELIAD